MLAIQSLAWGLVVLVAMMSLGRLIARFLLPTYRPDPFLAAGWGMAAMITLGGVLNMLGLATAPILVILICSIILADLLFTWRKQDLAQVLPSSRFRFQADWQSLTWMEIAGLLALAMMVAFKYASCLGMPLSYWDDKHAYLGEAVRMLQTGTIGDSPFSERQIISLNGQVFLNGLFLSAGSSTYAFVMDPGICWIMIAGFTWVILRNDLRATTLVSCILTALVMMVRTFEEPPSGPFLNLGGYLSGAVLMLTAVRTSYLRLAQVGRLPYSWLFLLTLTVAGLCAIKTTFLVVAVLFLLTWYGLRILLTKRTRLALEIMIVGISIVVFLAPWMVQQYRSGGTLLYPFLGHGNHTIAPEFTNIGGPFLEKLLALASFCCSGLFFSAFIALFLFARTVFREPSDFTQSTSAMLFAAVFGSMIVAYQGGIHESNAFHRYVQPMLYVALIPVGLMGLVKRQPSNFGLAVCLAIFIGNQWIDPRGLVRPMESVLRGTLPAARTFTRAERAEIEQAQQAIPAGATVLVSSSSLSQLDFRRNRIWNLDFPGMCSPGSAMPLPADLEDLAKYIDRSTDELPIHLPCDDLLSYFRQAGVQYVILRQEPNRFFNNINIDKYPRWTRIVRMLGVLYYRQLNELITRCPVVYQGTDMVVVAL